MDLILLVKTINLEDKRAKKSSQLKNAPLPKVILRSVLLSSLLLHSQGLVSILDLVFSLSRNARERGPERSIA